MNLSLYVCHCSHNHIVAQILFQTKLCLCSYKHQCYVSLELWIDSSMYMLNVCIDFSLLLYFCKNYGLGKWWLAINMYFTVMYFHLCYFVLEVHYARMQFDAYEFYLYLKIIYTDKVICWKKKKIGKTLRHTWMLITNLRIRSVKSICPHFILMVSLKKEKLTNRKPQLNWWGWWKWFGKTAWHILKASHKPNSSTPAYISKINSIKWLYSQACTCRLLAGLFITERKRNNLGLEWWLSV